MLRNFPFFFYLFTHVPISKQFCGAAGVTATEGPTHRSSELEGTEPSSPLAGTMTERKVNIIAYFPSSLVNWPWTHDRSSRA